MKGRRVLFLAAVFATLLLLPLEVFAIDYPLRFHANGGKFVWSDDVAEGDKVGSLNADGTVWTYTVHTEGKGLAMVTLPQNVLGMKDLWEYTDGVPGVNGTPNKTLREGPALEKDGYVLAGWYEEPACTTKLFSDHTEHYFESLDQYAKWVRKEDCACTVTFDFGGGSLMADDLKGVQRDKVSYKVYKGEPVLEQRDRALRFGLYSSTNEPFLYWTDSSGKPVNSPGSIVANGNLTFTAHYGANTLSSIGFNKTSLTLTEGQTYNLAGDTKGNYITQGRLSWSSSNPEAVWVDQNGVLTAAKDVGTSDQTAVITLEKYGDNSSPATVTVTVKSTKKNYTVTPLGGEATVYTAKVGDTVTVKAGTALLGRRFLKWQISPSVTFLNGTSASSSTVSFRMPDKAVDLKALDEPIPVKGISLAAKTMKLKPGQSKSLGFKTSPEGAPCQTIKYWSTDENVATVDLQGIVHAHSGGTCTVSVTVNGKFKASCKVTVPKTAVKKVAFNKSKLTLKKGKKYKLKLKVTPTGAWYKNVSWFCSESKVASVSAKGLVKAKGKGKCKITCTITTVNGKKKKATCKVTVK